MSSLPKTKKFSEPQALLNVGASVAAVDATARAVLEILAAPYADQLTKRMALKTMGRICSVNSSTISNCNFTTERLA